MTLDEELRNLVRALRIKFATRFIRNLVHMRLIAAFINYEACLMQNQMRALCDLLYI